MAHPFFLSVGLTNYTNYLLIVVRSTNNPTVEYARQSFGPAPTSLNITFNLNPEPYYFDFRDSINGVALGSLRSTFIVDGTTLQVVEEERYYTVDGPGTYDPVDGATKITDPYFHLKTPASVFKEGFRPLKPLTEWQIITTTTAGDTVEIINGTQFSNGEVVVIKIVYLQALPVTTNNALFSGVRTSTASETITAADYNFRIRLQSSTAVLTETLPLISTVPVATMFYFYDGGGTQKQAKIITQGADRIYWPQFTTPQISEVWVAQGQFVQFMVTDIAGTKYYEVISISSAIGEVGEIILPGSKFQNNVLLENGALYDGDEYPGHWWWLNNIAPTVQLITDDNVISSSFVHPAAKVGQYVKHSTLKKFRMPNSQNMVFKGLKDFVTYGGDTANRPEDNPGGFQTDMIMSHSHNFKKVQTQGSGTTSGYVNGLNQGEIGKNTELTGGIEQRVKNIGVIYGRRI